MIPRHWLHQICYIKKQIQIRGIPDYKEYVWLLYKIATVWDREAYHAAVHGVAKSQVCLSN